MSAAPRSTAALSNRITIRSFAKAEAGPTGTAPHDASCARCPHRGADLDRNCRPECPVSARPGCGGHRQDEFDAIGGGGTVSVDSIGDDPVPCSPLLVRVEDVVLRLHDHMARVSAV